MPHSLLDGADLAGLRRISADGPSDALAGALVDTGLLQFDPDDPVWEDRDRLVVAGPLAAGAIGRRLAAAGGRVDDVVLAASSGGEALALAFGAAMASDATGGAWRAWCLLDDEACDDGRVWEVARAAADAPANLLGVLTPGDGTQALWRACGWNVHEAPSSDPAWVLGALDQVVAGAPAVLVVVGDA